MDNNELPKIHCTTHIVLKNKLTGKTYKDEAERDADINDPNTETTADHIQQDTVVEVSPKGLNVLQKVMNQKNEEPKS